MKRYFDRHRYLVGHWMVALLLVLILIMLWAAGRGPDTAGCCGVAEQVSAAPVENPVTSRPIEPVTSLRSGTPPPSPCTAILAEALVGMAPGSSYIPPKAKAGLQKVVECLGDGKYEIGGHTDSSGDPEANMALSKRRAFAVRSALIQYGAKPENLTAAGYGDTDPISDNYTVEGKAKNRRVEIIPQVAQ